MFEALFAGRIGEAAAVKDEAAAVAGFVLGQGLGEGKTENPHDEIVRVGGKALQFFGGQHVLESVHQRGQRDSEPDVVKQPAQVFQGVGDALQKVGFAFIKAAKPVGAQGLHDANVNVGIKVLHECGAVELDEAGNPVEIMIEQLLAEVGGQGGLGIVQKLGVVCMLSAYAAAP